MIDRDCVGDDDIFTFIKPAIDIHTLGIATATTFLKECGFHVEVLPAVCEKAVENIEVDKNRKVIRKWLHEKHIDHIGYSYRLDPGEGERLFYAFYSFLRNERLLKEQGGSIRKVYFSGLPETCKRLAIGCGDRVIFFEGEETPEEFLRKIGVPDNLYPQSLKEENSYDKKRWQIAGEFLKDDSFQHIKAPSHAGYPDYGSLTDSLEKRLKYIADTKSTPIIRAHIGPFNENKKIALDQYSNWVKRLALSGYLDVLSIGSSQLTQSHFEKSWDGLLNGGGVPIQTSEEYLRVYEDARPMLVRSYAGTDNLRSMAEIHEKYLNIAWHALSFWWFNRLDGRGPLDLQENLDQTFDAMRFIAFSKKPLEANVSHHFAFRGADDVTYIASNYLTAKAAKNNGIRTYVVQNMLNTPKLTWGIQDIAKARAMLKLVRKLEDKNFRIIFETRAGLSYFSPNLEKAKRQLMAVTMLMDDIEPEKILSPEIIHVVGYSEAQYLADPNIVDESIKMTLFARKQYRMLKQKERILESNENEEINSRTDVLYRDALQLINDMETMIADLYSPWGFFEAFRGGYFPVPQLWAERETFKNAIDWEVRFTNGGYHVVDEKGKSMSMNERLLKVKTLRWGKEREE
jgi:hypothetical protein